jgi:hypothetical protein
MITARADAGEMAAEVRVGSGPLVVVSDGLNVDDLKMVASAVTASGRPCIEVRSERWDGESPSPLSAACRGVISGFGVDAARQAAAALESP